MPSKASRRAPLPAGLIPLIDRRQLETYYTVSPYQVQKWIDAGLPTEPFNGRGDRFDLNKVRAWMAEQDQLAATA